MPATAVVTARALRAPLSKPLVFLAGLLPAVLLAWQAWQQTLGPDPQEVLLHACGLWAFRFLLLSLSMTPLRLLGGDSAWIRFRRMFGLYAFFYACLHLCVYLLFFLGFDWATFLEDVVERPYITVGMLAWVVLLALAVTSNQRAIRKLGRRWPRLHRAVYAAGVLVCLHFVWSQKAAWGEAAVYALVFLVLMGVRVHRLSNSRKKTPT